MGECLYDLEVGSHFLSKREISTKGKGVKRSTINVGPDAHRKVPLREGKHKPQRERRCLPPQTRVLQRADIQDTQGTPTK